MNVNLQTWYSCFKSETLHLSWCSIKIPLSPLSGNEYALFPWIYVTYVYKRKGIK